MKKIHFVLLIILFYTLNSCNQNSNNEHFIGFWEGPHPENINKKFYVHVYMQADTVKAHAYWANNNFYESEFNIAELDLYGDSISFYVPSWDCFYKGKMINNRIKGGFACTGEPFDTVYLTKNDEISRYLTEALPGCNEPDYTYNYQVPKLLCDMLEISGLRDGGDSASIFSIIPEIIQGQYGRLNSFLILKNNRLVFEEYFYGYTSNKLHQIESSSKSVTSLLVGIAKDKGYIHDINEPIYKIFTSYKHLQAPEYKNITIKHLLTMTAGFSNENDELFQSENRMDYALKRKMINEPGESFNYDGGCTELLGAIIKEKTGMFADAFAKRYLFELLGIINYNWEILKQEGYPCMAGSLELLPRDMLKIGQMVLNDGKFDHKQIVSKEWLKESTSCKVTTHIENDNYGYQWWNITLNSNNKPYNCIWANGMGSQFIYIIPELDVVIVTTGYNYEFDSWAITTGISKYLYLLDN